MTVKTIKLPIIGMSCSSCSRSIEKQIEQLGGLLNKSINHETDSGEFTIDKAVISQQQLIEAINQGHYKVDLPIGAIIANGKKAIPACPVCKKQGAEVPNTVLRSNLIPATYKQTSLDDDFHICMNAGCSVAYYTTGENQLIDKSELKRELYFKDGSEKQIICYCNNVDMDQIKDTVLNHQITDWQGTMERYTKKVQEKCENLNPTGLCCRDLFDDVVGEIKETINTAT